MNEEVNIPNNLEIDKALKEFEAKSSAIPQPQVGQVPIAYDETPKMVRLVMKFSGGAIKEQRQAEYVLLGFVVLMIILSFFLFFGGNDIKPKPSDEALERMKLAPLGQ